MMDLNLSGKVVLISGSSRGIGRGIAEVMLNYGCSVFINSKERKSLDYALNELSKLNTQGKIFAIACDLTVSKNIIFTLNEIYKKTGKYPDIIVANIGSGSSKPGWDVNDKEWQRMLDINLLGAVKLCRESIRVMKNKGGSIICISSIAGCQAIAAPLPYSAAKSALLSFVKNSADAIAQYGIRINAISPGNVLFKNGVWDKKLRLEKKKTLKYIKDNVPLNGFATVYDIANMVAYLASDVSKFITGANFVIDGGQTRKFI